MTAECDELVRYIEVDWYAGKVGCQFGTPLQALSHYLSEGERRGYWPNRLFNPEYYRCHAGIPGLESALVHFVRTGLKAKINPCRLFNLEWYEWRNPGYTEGNGFLHFLRRGADEGRHPSPWVDMTSMRRNRPGSWNGADLIYAIETGEIAIEDCAGITSGVSDLARRQRKFLSSIEVKEVKVSRTAVRGRNLLFVQAADGANFWSWFDPAAERDWDLLVNCYQTECRLAHQGEHVFVQHGTKFTGVFNIWRMFGHILDFYDYVFLIDDDLMLLHQDISKFFSEISAAGLDTAQPALSAASHATWPVFKRKAANGVRSVNCVEIMMPALSRAARAVLLPHYMLSVSGFGLDLLSQKFDLKAGVVDSVEVTHAKAIDEANGAYYEYLRANGINPQAELWRIMKAYGIRAEFYEHGDQALF